MPPFTVQDIVRATQGALVAGDLGVPVTGVSIDSRTLGVGEAFFAIRGYRLDGHAFLADAASRGAACLVVQALHDDVPANVPLVLVEDTTRALGLLAAYHRARFSIPVVAVTGSNGKTTTKELIAGVLGVRWQVLKPSGSFNNQWGLPLTLLRLAAEHQALVLEIGSQHPGEIAALAELARPTVAAVTTIAHAHTEFLGSLDGVRAEKVALVRAVGAEGRVVLNADDPRVAGMARDARAPVITYGRSAAADVRATGEPVEDARSLTFTLESGGARAPVTLAFVGRHNVTNALAAAAVGVALGWPLDEIARGLGEARPVAGRCVWRDAGGVRILDDTYNANPVSVRAALETAAARRAAAPSGRLVVVLGDMLELGAIAEEAHQEMGRAVVAAGADEFVGVGRMSRLAVETARAAGLVEARHATTFEDTVAHLLKRVASGDVVLVKGSRGMRMERVVDALVARLAR
ncbi:MAG: UDP-N-acetylmuramoyl-tripeptide--D-alanyl-D-alanine ligase [Candidatus Rokuibacteriota bacterium]|nr:MAG: UDP-N-acetylmuramoyl-tripeptide--D-alanyl-D-alanine ligase [Candidatus Rokubacteria bacterium]